MPSISAVDGLGTTKTSLVPATTVRGALFYRLSRNPILSFCVTNQFFPRLVSGAQLYCELSFLIMEALRFFTLQDYKYEIFLWY